MTAPASRTEVGIRGATRADLLEVFEIEKQSFAQPWPYAAFEQQLDAPGFLVAEGGSEVVGYVVADRIRSHGASIGHVKDLAVAPARRGEGIASRLLSSALVELYVDGVQRVKLEVRESNEAARALYDRFDFEVHHVLSGYYDDGEDAHVMVRSEPVMPSRS